MRNNPSRQNNKRTKQGYYHIALLALIVLIVGLVVVYAQTRPYSISINGHEIQLQGRHSITSLVDDGIVRPKPGNFLAVDGSILVEGGGTPYTASMEGTDEVKPDKKLSAGAVLYINDGTDIIEPFVESSETIPQDIVEVGTGPIHIIEPGAEGLIRIRTGEQSGIQLREELSSPTPDVCKKYYPDTGGEKVIALTLDDGPWDDHTEDILDILADNQVKATFFVIGTRIESSERNASLVKRAFDEGHQVATHTYSHASGDGQGVNLGYMQADDQISEVLKGYESIKNVTGEDPSPILRTPGGNYGPETQKILQPYITAEIGWTVDTYDWTLPPPEVIVENIMDNSYPGGIILAHDGGGNRKGTVRALELAIPKLKNQGYRFITIDELLEYPPIEH